jgi:hypothetical protein
MIIGVTGNVVGYIEESKTYGADAVLDKPLNMVSLIL